MSMMAFGPGGFGGRMGRMPDEGKSYDGLIMRRLFGYLRPSSLSVGVSFVSLLASTALSLLGPDLLRIAIDDGVLAQNRTALNLAALAFLGTTAAAWATSYVGFRMLTTVGQRVLKTIRTDEFTHLQRLSLRFFSRQEIGQVMSRVTNDVDAINEFLTAGLVMALISFFTLSYIFVRLLLMDLRLALATFLVLPLMMLVTGYFSRRARTLRFAEFVPRSATCTRIFRRTSAARGLPRRSCESAKTRRASRTPAASTCRRTSWPGA